MTRAPIVLCAGQYGSASTWLYNAIHALMVAAVGEARVHRQFADRADSLPERTDRRRLLLIKAHEPGPGLRWLVARGGGRVVVSARDPRDAVASVIGRFGFDFPLVAGRVERCSAALPALLDLPCLVLRYEDGFGADEATLARIAGFLGLAVPPPVIAQVFENLRPDAVRAEIARLAAEGAFGETPTSDRHDPTTHWHPGHVGDGAPGKFARLLSPGQIGEIIRRTRPFQAAFDYPMPPPPPMAIGQALSCAGWGPGLAYLDTGFAAADERGAWTEGPEARLLLPVPPDLPRAVLEMEFELPRLARARRGSHPPNPMLWSLWAEGGQAPIAGRFAAANTPERVAIRLPLPPGRALILRFEQLVPAEEAGSDASKRLFGMRLRGFGLTAG
jgi:hypothetical protein